MSVHIYTTYRQPATRWKDTIHVGNGKSHTFVHTERPHRLLWTSCCRKRRQARNLDVKVYYDCVQTFCRTGCTAKRRPRAFLCPTHGKCRGCATTRRRRAA